MLLVGVGGVGEAIAAIAKSRPWIEMMVLADYNSQRAGEVQQKLIDRNRFPMECIDASNQQEIEALARKHGVDLIMNAVDPIFNKQIFDAAYNVGAHYMDMAMSLSEPHPEDPFHKTGIKLGDYQFAQAEAWERKGLLALVGMGVEPGMADVFARYAADHLSVAKWLEERMSVDLGYGGYTQGAKAAAIAGTGATSYAVYRRLLGQPFGAPLASVAAPGYVDLAVITGNPDLASDLTGNFTANQAGGMRGPWFILFRESDVLVSAITSSRIHRFTHDGEPLGDFHGPIAFPQQMQELENGNILVSNFSAPSGVWELASIG